MVNLEFAKFKWFLILKFHQLLLTLFDEGDEGL